MAAVGLMAYPARESFQSYPQQYAMYPTRAHQASTDVVSSLHANPYASFAQTTQHQQHQQHQAPQQPPSRSPHSSEPRNSEDGSRPSLPSISNLLGIADGDRPSQEEGKLLSSVLRFPSANTQTQRTSHKSHSSSNSNNNNKDNSKTRLLRNRHDTDHHIPRTSSRVRSRRLFHQHHHCEMTPSLSIRRVHRPFLPVPRYLRNRIFLARRSTTWKPSSSALLKRTS